MYKDLKMFTTPSLFNAFLRKNNLVNDVYEAMESDDYSDVVMAAMKVLQKENIKLRSKREIKCEMKSDYCRSDGNVAFKRENVLLAMHHYNRALRYAPNKSRAMLLAYSNRSAVLFTTEHFAECLSDIETCFRLGCPSDIVDKLNKRKESALAKLADKGNLSEMRAFYKKFSHIDNCNAEVPCASADVEIVVNDGVAKITAAKNIKVGTVLAAETSFVGCINYKTLSMAILCRNCFTKSLNVIPCDGCCFIMYCSEKCKRKCQQEYHNVECQIMEVIEATDFRPRTILMVAGALKFVQMCDTWKEVIVESHCTGSKRRRVSKASQMFDVGHKLNILNYDEDNIIVHGIMYENSFICANIIDSLDKLPSFFPQSPCERTLAKRAVARIMMYLALYSKPTQVVLIEQPPSSLPTDYHARLAYHGLYPFIGKLQNSCTPNTIVSHAGNKFVLIALQPITKGSELTVSHMGHYLDTKISKHEKNIESFTMYGRVCKCFICTDEWRTRRDVLTEDQRVAFKKYMSHVRHLSHAAPFQSFPIVCDILACLSSAPFSKEYVKVYKDFRERITFRNFFNDA